MKEFDLYIKKLNAITKKYDDSPLLEQKANPFEVDNNLKDAIITAKEGLAKGKTNKSSVTIADVFTLDDLENIWFALKTVDITEYEKSDLEQLLQWVNISIQNGITKENTYGLKAGISLVDGIQGRSDQDRLERFGRTDNLWKDLVVYHKQINDDLPALINTYDSAEARPYQNVPIQGSDITVDDLIRALDDAEKSNFEKSVYKAIEDATGQKVRPEQLTALFKSVQNESEVSVSQLEALWQEAEAQIEIIKDRWRGVPPYTDSGLDKARLESLAVYDIFRGYQGRDERNAYTDLGNWAFSTADRASWISQLDTILPTVSKLAVVIDGLEKYQEKFLLTKEQKADVDSILRYADAVKKWNQYLQELQNQRRMAAAATSAGIAQQRFNVRDKLIGQTAQKQRINNQIGTAARKIKNASAATPSGGYMPHRIAGGMREIVSAYFVSHPEVEKAFRWLSVAQNLIEPESSTTDTDTITTNVLGDPIITQPLGDPFNEDVEKPAKNRPANILQHNFRKKAIEDLKKAYVKLKANELFFTKQVEPYSQDGRVAERMTVYYGIDATDLENVQISPGGKIDESLVYGLTEATQQVLELYAVTIPTIIRNSKAQVGSLQNAEKSKKLFNNPPNIEIDYADLDAQAETRANLLYSARDDLIAQEEADRQKQEEREKWIELQNVMQNFRAADQASMENWREYEEQLQNERYETFRDADRASMENWTIFQTERDAINLWNSVKEPFERSLLFYGGTGVPANQISELKNQWDAALASNMAGFINDADGLVYETIKNGIDEIDEKFTNTINYVLPQSELKIKKYEKEIDKQEKLYKRDPRLVDRAILYAGPQNIIEGELNELEGSDIARYIDSIKLAELKGRLQTTRAKLERLQKGFKLYDDPFMETFRQLDNLALRLILSDEPFYKAQSLNQYADLYDKLITLMPETKTKFSQFTYNDIILKKRDDITALTKTVFLKKMNDFFKQDIYEFFTSVPLRYEIRNRETNKYMGMKWLSYGIHNLMDKKEEYDRLVTEIENLESVQEQINVTMKTFTKDRLPTTDVFKLLFKKDRWEKLPELFDDIKLLNDKREGNSVNYKEFQEYIHQLINSIEFLDFVVAEYIYSKNIYPKPHDNPVIQSAFEALKTATYRNQFSPGTIRQLRNSNIAFKEDGTGVWDILLRDYPKTGRNKYDNILKSQDNNAWKKGSGIRDSAWATRDTTGYDAEVKKND